MGTKYEAGGGLMHYGPAAAFDVLDLDPHKITRAETAIAHFNAAATVAAHDGSARSALRDDVRSVDGMARFPAAGADMPWHADRPAIAMYDSIAGDGRLDSALRLSAAAAGDAIGDLVLAHHERGDFSPFGGVDYSNAAGPTIHAPVKRSQVDPWASRGISETDNAFYRAVHQDRFARAIA
jgi:hypothetical protein